MGIEVNQTERYIPPRRFIYENCSKINTARFSILTLSQAFPKEQREMNLFGENNWSLKNVLSHISGWNNLTTETIGRLRCNESPDFIEDVNKFNRKQVEKRRDWDWIRVFGEFERSSSSLIYEYTRTPLQLFKIPLFPAEDPSEQFTLRDSLEIDAQHYKEHEVDINERILEKI